MTGNAAAEGKRRIVDRYRRLKRQIAVSRNATFAVALILVSGKIIIIILVFQFAAVSRVLSA